MPGSTRKDAAPPFPDKTHSATAARISQPEPLKDGYWPCSNTSSTTAALNFEKQHTENLKNHVKKYKQANSFSLKPLFYKKLNRQKKLRFLGMLYIDPMK